MNSSVHPLPKNTFKYTSERYRIEKKTRRLNTVWMDNTAEGFRPSGIGLYDEWLSSSPPKSIIHLRTSVPAGSSRAAVRGALLLRRRRQHYRNSTGANGRRTSNAVGRVRVIDGGGTNETKNDRVYRDDNAGTTIVRAYDISFRGRCAKDATERIAHEKLP